MTYTEEQKDLLLDLLFNGVVCFNIYHDIHIRHKNKYLSIYYPKIKAFKLNWDNIWRFFVNKNADNYIEIRDLTSTILRDLTKQNKLKTW